MNFALKSLVAAAAIASIGVANAASVTTNVGQTNTFGGQSLTLTGGTGTLSFSESLLAALNVGSVAVTAVAPATVTGTPAGNNVKAAAPITSVTADNVTGAVTGVATAGGALQTSPVTPFISGGGTLSVTNLNVDLTNKRIYASLTGAFGGAATGTPAAAGSAITTIDNFYLWNYANITGATNITGAGSFNTSITGLTITQSGYNHFVSALRLGQFGTAALQSVTDYGSINSTITVTAAIPEPSTYALMGLGLAGIAVAARRRAK